MTQARHIILGIHVTDRARHADEVQRILTEYGCHIRTRIGIHEVDRTACSPNGLILLEVLDDPPVIDKMTDRLRGILGVEVQRMVFDHP